MINEVKFNEIVLQAKKFSYSSLNYVDFEECTECEVIEESASLILFVDMHKEPAMIYYATDDFSKVINWIKTVNMSFRLHFVPKEYALQLTEIGFEEWGEYTDFWNNNLTDSLVPNVDKKELVYLDEKDCEKVSALSHRCRLQSRGFEGETTEWFREWLKENRVIIIQSNLVIVGFCCVALYDNGQKLWIREIAVDPLHQNQGIGKKLIEQAVIFGVNHGAAKGYLAADILNKKAIALYNRYGFVAGNEETELQMVRIIE